MRSFKISILALAVLCMSAAQSLAFEYTLSSSYAGAGLAINDTIVVDVFLDADPGISLLSLAVTFDLNDELAYNGPASAALPPQGPGTSGAQPSYLLYTPGSGSLMTMVPATILYPQQTPYWLKWAGTLPPGKDQINVNYAESALNGAQGSGTGIYIASMLFDVVSLGDGTNTIELCNTCGGNVLQVDGITIIDPATIPLTGTPIVVNVPEPAAAGLAAVALGGMALLYRRRS